MKLQWASGLLLGAAVSYADSSSHIPFPFTTDSSDVHVPSKGPIDPEQYLWQAKPHKGARLDRSAFTLTCSSEHAGNKCDNAKDGLVETYWRSNSNTGTDGNYIIVTLAEEKNVNGLSMLPILDNGARGQIGTHEVFLSKDGHNWDKVAFGTWGWNKSIKISVFEAKAAKYVKLVAKSESPPLTNPQQKWENTWTSIVDINVYTTDYTVLDNPDKGAWGPTLDLPIVPVAGAHAAGLNGEIDNVILWSAWSDNQFFASPGGATFTTTWNPGTQNIIQADVTNTQHDMFCPGISMDIDGKVVVTGGADSDKTSIFNGTGWERGESMKLTRGYHATTTLSDGRIFAIGGSWSGGMNSPKDGEVYDPKRRSWQRLTGIPADHIHTDDKPLRNDNHAWLFGWKQGTVFHAGPSKNMFWFDPNSRNEKGTLVGSVKAAGPRLNDQHSTSGNAVMFDATAGKILTFGGQELYDGSFGTRNAHLITLGEPNKKPKVKVAGLEGTAGDPTYGGMLYQRVFHTSVVLPDGTVFIAGGEIYGKPFNERERDIQLVPEIYYPHNDTFVPLQPNNVVRVYHSFSMLLPDATVLNGGGGLCGNCTVNHYDAQVFKPPYLFNPDGTNATRPATPVVTNKDSRVTLGHSIHFQGDSTIEAASLVRLGSVSHTVNTDQRRVPVKVTCKSASSSSYYSSSEDRQTCEAQVPSDPGVALPGYYMLFVLNDKGVPSKAATVKVELPKSGPHPIAAVEDVEDDDETEEEGCGMDAEQMEGMIAALAVQTKKFWKTWRSALVSQA